MTLPAPLTPPECDLTGFDYIPWQFARFRKSQLVAHADAEAILAAILLYGEAWSNVPAASLENNDKALAGAAGYGRAVEAWRAVKAEALRGWIECSDGRLYHPVLAEKARTAWQSRLEQRHRTFCATVRKHNERNPSDRRTAPNFDQWLNLGRPEKVARENAPPAPTQTDLDLPEAEPERTHASEPKSATNDEKSRVTAPNVTRDKSQCHINVARDMASKGEGEGKGEGKGDSIEDSEDSPQTPLYELTAELAAIAGVPLTKAKTRADAEAQVKAWLDDGIDPDTLRTAIRTATAQHRTASWSLKRFASAVRHQQVKAKAAPRPTSPKRRTYLGPDDDDQRIAQLRSGLAQRLGARTYANDIEPTRMTLNGSGVVIAFPNAFACDLAEQNLSRAIAAEAAHLNLGTVKLTVA